MNSLDQVEGGAIPLSTAGCLIIGDEILEGNVLLLRYSEQAMSSLYI